MIPNLETIIKALDEQAHIVTVHTQYGTYVGPASCGLNVDRNDKEFDCVIVTEDGGIESWIPFSIVERIEIAATPDVADSEQAENVRQLRIISPGRWQLP